MTTPTELKVPLTPISLGEIGLPSVANRQPSQLEQNVDNIIAYLDGNSLSDFDVDNTLTLGTVLQLKGGTFRKGNTNITLGSYAGNLSLGDGTYYVFIDSVTGTIGNNNTGFLITHLPLYTVTVSGGVIVENTIIDNRVTSYYYDASTTYFIDTSVSFTTDNIQSAIEILDSNKLEKTGFTADSIVITDNTGAIDVYSGISSVELSYLIGVSSNIQTQLNTLTSNLATHNHDGTYLKLNVSLPSSQTIDSELLINIYDGALTHPNVYVGSRALHIGHSSIADTLPTLYFWDETASHNTGLRAIGETLFLYNELTDTSYELVSQYNIQSYVYDTIVGRTSYVDETLNRAFNTQYSTSSLRGRFIVITANITLSSGTFLSSIKVGGVEIAQYEFTETYDGFNKKIITFFVPKNTTYRVDVTGVNYQLISWFECS